MSQAMDLPSAIRAFRQAQSVAARHPDELRVSILANFTADALAAALWQLGQDQGLQLRINVVAPAERLAALHGEGGFYQQDPELILLLPLLRGTEMPEQLQLELEQAVQTIRAHSKAHVVIGNVAAPVRPLQIGTDPERRAAAVANAALETLAQQGSGVSILDLDALFAFHGHGGAISWKRRYLADLDLAPEFTLLLAEAAFTHARLLRHAARKVLALDLDNTLWGGVVGEDGAHGLSLAAAGPGAEYAAFQRELLRLRDRGVLLVVVSKNNQEDALSVLREHPHCLLRPEHLAAYRINWTDKASNLREIAEELNLGLDSFVFLDDSPQERDLVRKLLPQVLVPELPADPVLYVPFLRRLDVFEQLRETAEDRQRAQMYAERSVRLQAMAGAASLEDFIADLGIEVTITALTEAGLPRAAQMIAKTNQFNLTTRRHSASDLAAMLHDPSFAIYALETTDRFGPSGVSGLAILHFAGGFAEIDTLLMSCRILGRRIEHSFLAVLAEQARRHAGTLVGLFAASERNAQVAGFYQSAGFQPAASPAGEPLRFAYSLDGDALRPHPTHVVTFRGAES